VFAYTLFVRLRTNIPCFRVRYLCGYGPLSSVSGYAIRADTDERPLFTSTLILADAYEKPVFACTLFVLMRTNSPFCVYAIRAYAIE